MKLSRIAAVVVIASPVVLAACRSSDESSNPMLATLSPAARDAFGPAIGGSEPFRMGMSMQTEITAGEETETMGSDEPVVTVEVDSDGEMYQRHDPSVAQETTGVEVPPDSIMEIWVDGDESVWRVGDGFGDLLGSLQSDAVDNPELEEVVDAMDAALRPGTFTVEMGELDQSDLYTVTESAGTNDPLAVFEALAESYPSEGEGDSRSYTLTMRDLVGSEQGLESISNSFSAGMEGADPEEVQKVIGDLLDTDVQATVSTDEDGRVTEAILDMDLSGFFQAFVATVFGQIAEISGELSEQDQALMDEQLEGLAEAQMVQTTTILVEYDDSIDVEIPSDVSDDRTEEMIEYLKSAQSLGGTSEDESSDASEDA